MAFLSTARRRPCPHLRRRASLLDLLALYRQRRALGRLDDRALDDIGVTRKEAHAEARRPVWNVPRHWVE